MLVESVYFPALAAMLFDACSTNSGLKAVLLKQAAAYAKSLRPLLFIVPILHGLRHT